MPVSQSSLAEEIRKLRPGLIQAARRLRRCRYEDAEDLVSDAVLSALTRLHEYDEKTGREGLKQWLIGILFRIVQRDHRQEAAQIMPEPLSAAQNLQADESVHSP